MYNHSTEKIVYALKHSIFQHTLKLIHSMQEVKFIIINLPHQVAKKLFLIHCVLTSRKTQLEITNPCILLCI